MSIDPLPFARSLNEELLHPGATEGAAVYLRPVNIRKVNASFDLLDPYVQSVLIQSAIYLNYEQFDAVRDDYNEIIKKALKSEYEWVRRTATAFVGYPLVTPPEDLPELSVVMDGDKGQPLFNVKMDNTGPNPVHFHLDPQNARKRPSLDYPMPEHHTEPYPPTKNTIRSYDQL